MAIFQISQKLNIRLMGKYDSSQGNLYIIKVIQNAGQTFYLKCSILFRGGY